VFIHVRRIPSRVHERDLHRVFASYGRVLAVRPIRDRESLIEMANPWQGKRAIEQLSRSWDVEQQETQVDFGDFSRG
jgi:hypothetical protein